MNYADMGMGTGYPRGGMFSVVESMVRLAEEQGVVFHYIAEVEHIHTHIGLARVISLNGQMMEADLILSTGDYHHTESALLE
jgi:phytoene desaturase